MKNFIQILFLLLLFSSCQTQDDPVKLPEDEDPRPVAGAVTPVGAPTGSVVKASIGQAGGSVSSSDRRIHVTIPSNALTAEQTISIQAINNNCPGGTGMGFRLEPHGVKFAKPVRVTFNYDDADLSGSAASELKIAYQNEKGIWHVPKVVSLDTVSRSVTIETTHFSDWGLFRKTFINPVSTMLNPGEHVHLQVFQIAEAESPDPDELAVPLPELVPAKYIRKWALNGKGTLKHEYATGDYYAPEEQATTAAAVTVLLNKTAVIDGIEFKDLRLMCAIYVTPEGISIQIDRGEWQTFPGAANFNGIRNLVAGKNGDQFIAIGWIGGPSGTFRWTKDPKVSFSVNHKGLVYSHLYDKAPLVANGSLIVESVDDTWVKGSFTVSPAGWINTNTKPITTGIASINGVFRVKRAN
jgi:hypothetical protein